MLMICKSRPTCRPALALLDTAFLADFPLPRPDILQRGDDRAIKGQMLMFQIGTDHEQLLLSLPQSAMHFDLQGYVIGEVARRSHDS